MEVLDGTDREGQRAEPGSGQMMFLTIEVLSRGTVDSSGKRGEDEQGDPGTRRNGT